MKLTRNKCTGLICFAVGVILSIMASRFKPLIQLNEPGPSLFPMIGSIGLAICGIGIFFEKEKEEKEVFLTKEGWIRVIQLAAILIIYTVCIKFFGFIYPMPFFLFAMIEALATKEKRPKLIVAACVAVTVTLLIYVVFTYVFKIVLPVGILFE